MHIYIYRWALISFLLSVGASTCLAQFSFYPYSSNDYQKSKNYYPLALVDVNNDGLDDMVRLDLSNRLMVEYNSSNQKKLIQVFSEVVIDFKPTNIVVGDIDNAGTNEIILSGPFTGIYIFEIVDYPDAKIILRQFIDDLIYAQGSNLVDIDNDGLLDLFVCNDEGISSTYINHNGQLVRTELFDMSTLPASDNSGNYSSEWADVDDDSDLDLYLSKCSVFASESRDPRRVNTLYINDGQQGFRESAKDFGLDIGDQSWSTSFSDLDNDGDSDAFIINHSSPFLLLENIANDTFIDRSEKINFIAGSVFELAVRDIDNNGFKDIIITGSKNYTLLNFGHFVFQIIENPFDQYKVGSIALGDIDDNGFYDILASYPRSFDVRGSLHDILWMNQGNTNHFIKFTLKGTSSNINGIGAKLKLYGDWGIQVSEVKAGEGYGVMNSLNTIFGLGTITNVDSLQVIWPSGQIDKHYDLLADNHYLIEEGNCARKYEKNYTHPDNFQVCDSITLSFQEQNIHWQGNLMAQPSYSVNQNGVYHATFIDQNGCLNGLKGVYVHIDSVDTPIQIFKNNEAVCAGEPVTLTGNINGSYQWSTGETLQQINVISSGLYGLSVTGICGAESMDSIRVDFSDPEITSIREDTIQDNRSLYILSATCSEGYVAWYDDELGIESISLLDSLILEGVEDADTFFVSCYQQTWYPIFEVGERLPDSSAGYSSNDINTGLVFSCHEDMILDSVTVYTDTPGKRVIEVFDSKNKLVYQDTFELSQGINQLNLETTIPKGDNYQILTNASFNLAQMGFRGPRLLRNYLGTGYPYELEGICSIINSLIGPDYYNYFYNWKIRQATKTCESDRKQVILHKKQSLSNENLLTDQIRIYPNPSSELLYIKYMNDLGTSPIAYLITDLLGHQIMHSHLDGERSIDISTLRPGVYFISIAIPRKGQFIHKFSKL